MDHTNIPKKQLLRRDNVIIISSTAATKGSQRFEQKNGLQHILIPSKAIACAIPFAE